MGHLYRHSLARSASGFALALVAALVIVAPAGAAPSPVVDEEVSFSSGELDWGFDDAFRCDLVGLIGRGSIEVSEGATQIPGSTAQGTACARDASGSEAIRFPVIGDYYDPETDSFGIQTEGAVRFTGYPGIPLIDETPTLDFTVRDVYVTAEGAEGSLLADVEGVTPAAEEPLLLDDVTLVNLDLSDVTLSERKTGIDWTGIPAELTEEGAQVFSRGAAGDSVDPVSISAEFDPFELEPGPSDSPGRIEALDPARVARSVRVARVICSNGDSPCGLISPGRITIRGGGKSAAVRVKYPFKLGAGRRADVKLVLAKPARRLVKDRGRARSKLRLTVTRDGEAVSKVIRVLIRG